MSDENLTPNFENPADVVSTVTQATGEVTKAAIEVVGNTVESASRASENAASRAPDEYADRVAELGKRLDTSQVDAGTEPSGANLTTRSVGERTSGPADTQLPDTSSDDHTAEPTGTRSDGPLNPAIKMVESADRSRAPAKEGTDPAETEIAEKDRYIQESLLDELDHATADAPFTNKHRDCYPPEAADLAERLPKRVMPDSGEKTHAVARWGDKALPTVISGHGELADYAKHLLLTHGCTDDEANFLKSHAEIKVVELVLRRAYMTDVEVAINYTPCGIEKQQDYKATCDKLLGRIFPVDGDRSLTVYGTDQDNQPYKKRYGRPQP